MSAGSRPASAIARSAASAPISRAVRPDAFVYAVSPMPDDRDLAADVVEVGRRGPNPSRGRERYSAGERGAQAGATVGDGVRRRTRTQHGVASVERGRSRRASTTERRDARPVRQRTTLVRKSNSPSRSRSNVSSTRTGRPRRGRASDCSLSVARGPRRTGRRTRSWRRPRSMSRSDDGNRARRRRTSSISHSRRRVEDRRARPSSARSFASRRRASTMPRGHVRPARLAAPMRGADRDDEDRDRRSVYGRPGRARADSEHRPAHARRVHDRRADRAVAAGRRSRPGGTPGRTCVRTSRCGTCGTNTGLAGVGGDDASTSVRRAIAEAQHRHRSRPRAPGR